MSSILKRTFAALGVAVLTVAGVTIAAAPAQALPGSAVFEEGNCAIPDGDGTVDGLAFTVTNAATVDAALTYEVVINFATVDQTITLAPGESRRTVLALPEDENTTVQLRSTGDDGFFAGNLASVDCVGNYSPTVTGGIESSCLLDTGGVIGEIPGVQLTADNSEGDTVTSYSFTVGDVALESGSLAPGETRVRSTTLDEDTPTRVVIGSAAQDGGERVLAQQDITLNCVADTPVITSPTEGQVLLGSPTTVTGRGTPGDVVSVAIADATKFDVTDEGNDVSTLAAAPVTVPTVSGDGYTVFVATVAADGTFAVQAPLPVGSYGVVALAARTATAQNPASISLPSAIVRFSVAAPVVTPAGTVAGAGTLAATGFAPALPISLAGGLLLAGVGVLLTRRRRTL